MSRGLAYFIGVKVLHICENVKRFLIILHCLDCDALYKSALTNIYVIECGHTHVEYQGQDLLMNPHVLKMLGMSITYITAKMYGNIDRCLT